jgi:divalent metal cation (Fe/Co/Zn/Cd) transporter
MEPRAITHIGWAAAVLFAALLFEGVSLGVAVREARRVEPRRSLWRFVRRSRDPDVPSVLLEDAGAVLGAALGLGFLAMAIVTGDTRWDAAGGIAVALLLLSIGAILCIEFKSLLIGEAALPEDRAEIEAAIVGHPKVRSIESLRTLHLAPDQLLVLVQVDMDPALGFREAAEVVDSIQHRVRSAVAHATVVHVEPETRPAPGAPPGPDARQERAKPL